MASSASAMSDVYQNPDGSYTRKVFGGPVNFQAPDGSWTPIDTGVGKSGDGRWHQKANGPGVDFAGFGDDAALVSVRADAGHAVAYGLAGAARVTPVASGSRMTYAGVLPGTDLVLTSQANGEDEALVLHSAQVATSWVFPLRLQGVSPRLNGDGSVDFVNAAGAVLETVPPGVMSDSSFDPHSGEPMSSRAVTYQLTTVAGVPALTMSVDAAWLTDPARVFPVRVDPTLSLTANGSTFATTTFSGNNSGSPYLKAGTYDGGSNRAYSFLQFSNFNSTFNGARMNGVSLHIFDTWAYTCTPEPFYVNPVTQPWDPSGVTSYPGPSFGSAIGSVTANPGAACGNTGLNTGTGVWMAAALGLSTFNSWSTGGANWGLAVTASQTDSMQWKQFDSVNTTNKPYLSVSYTSNQAPVVSAQYPPKDAALSTLTPDLLAAGSDPDSWPSPSLQYQFWLFDSNGSQIATSNPISSGSWHVAAGTLSWGQVYGWLVAAFDGYTWSSISPASWFATSVPQPAVTSKLSQNPGGHGFDPSIGNYTTEAVDAQVVSVGPPLSVVREYNSADPRSGLALGAGWSSMFDARVTEQPDSSGAVQTVVVTYPDGQQVAYGRNADGSFTPTPGRYATVAAVSGGGYTLTDKANTVYRFTRGQSTGVYGITSITDAGGSALTFAYVLVQGTGGPRFTYQLTSVTSSVSGRVLHVAWDNAVHTLTDGSQAPPHIMSITTDPATAGDSSTALTWRYSYAGDRLTQVCPPTSTTACTTYSYTAATHYPTTVQDVGAHSYWRLNETGQATTAASSVLANEQNDSATYSNVALGQPGPLPGSTATAAGFNGTSSYLDLTGGAASKAVVTNSSYQSISLWFKTTTGNSVLFSYQSDAVSNTTTAGNYVPALYVGADGKLQGLFWCGCGAPIASNGSVADGNWHHVVLAGGGNTQSLYLDSVLVGTRPGVIQLYNANGTQNSYVGAGFLGGGWPDESHYNPGDGTGYPMYFSGSISDVAFFDKWLGQDNIAALYSAGHLSNQVLSGVTTPLGRTATTVAYDSGSDRVVQVTDGNGGVWRPSAPAVSGSSQVYRSSVLGSAPLDYWRLGDGSGQTAVNQIKGGTAAYNAVTLGTEGAFGAGDDTAASFNGTSSFVSLPGGLMPGAGVMSTEMWFNTTKTGGILLSEQAQALGGAACPCVPVLWVGPDGTLRGSTPATTPTGPLTGMANKCLDLSAFGTALGTKVQLWTCTGAANQVWQPWPDGSIRNPVSGRCLDISAYGTSNGTNVRLWDCTGAANQVWQPQPDGSWKNPQSGRCLDLQGPSSADGTQAWIWDCYAGAGQPWKASFVSPSAVNDGKWHQVVLASDGTNQAMYLDGAVIGKSAGPALTSTPQLYTYAGAGHTAGGTGTAWNGLPAGTDAYVEGAIDEVSFYTHGLTAADAQAHYAGFKSSAGVAPTQTVTVTDPGGQTLAFSYDASRGNRLIKQTDALGKSTTFGYDTDGFLNTVTDPNGVVTTTGHDVRGNTVSHTTCQNQTANTCSTAYYSYYPDDTSKSPPADPRNDLLIGVRDGRSVSATDNTYLTTYTYDTAGRRTGITTPPVPGYPAGRTTGTAYTDSTTPAFDSGFAPPGLPWSVTTAGGVARTTRYFHNGDIASSTDATGLLTRFGYDNLGRVTSQTVVSATYPSGLVTTYSYDGLNRVVTVTDPPVTNRVTGAVHTARSTSAYDADSNTTSVTVADTTGGDASRTSSATFNALGQRVTVTDPVGNVTTLGYDAYGNATKAIDPAGNETDQVYDPNGQLLTTTLKGYTADPVNPSPATNLVLSSRAYDPAGRLASVTDSMGRVTAYTYTDNGLTATVTRSDPAHPGTTYAVESDSYDAAGNMVSKTTNNGVTTMTFAVDPADRVAGATLDPTGVNRSMNYTYSADDTVLARTLSDGTGAHVVTDATYDALGRVVSQTVHDTSTTPVGRWTLADGTGTRAADSDGNQPGTLTAGATWSSGHGGSATFSGGGGFITTTVPVVDTSASFTVSAWVYLTSTGADQVAVAQDGPLQSVFTLGYDSGLNKWVFGRPADDTTRTIYKAASATSPTLSTWTHLAGVFDATTGAMTLYVNGAAQGSANDSTPMKSSGALVIGRGVTPSSERYWAGSLADVQAYNQALTPAQVGAVSAGSLPAAGSLRLTSSRSLDQRGLPTSATDPDGNTTGYAFDEAGRAVVTTAPTVNTEANGGTAVPTRPVSMVGYDTFGALVETSDANGNVRTAARDANGRPTSVTGSPYTPPGSSTTLTPVASRTYNRLGQVVADTDPLGHQTSYTYDQLGNQATTTAANGGTTHTTYDTNGEPLSVTGPTGALTQATYDYLGREATATQVVRQPTASAYTTTYAYATAGGWMSAQTSPACAVASSGYDSIGETTSVTDAAGKIYRYSYDYAGRTTKTLLPDGTAETATFDVAGRQTAAAQLDTNGSALASTSAAYDPDGQPLSATDPRGNTSRFTYDAANRLTTQTQPVIATTSIITSFGYDAVGNRTRFTDGRGNPFITTYNTWNMPESQIEPATPTYPNLTDRTFTTSYDVDGQVTSQTAPGGVTVTNTYNTIGNLTGQTGAGADASTTARSFGYDTAGRMTSASAPGGTDTFSYDDRSLLLSTSGPSGASSFTYTPDDLMASRTDAAGTTAYTYDNADRLKTLHDPATGTTLTYAYNSLSQPASVTYGTGDVRSFGYDQLHRLTSDILSTPASVTVGSIGYGYDANGNETSKTTAGFAGSTSNTYTYDYANRLTSWTNGTGSSAYAYDASGNRTQSGTQTFTYNARNQLTSGAGATYAYTPRGTLASVTTGSATTSTSDAFGQTITQGGQTYAYDALGRTITATGSTSRTLTYTGPGNTVASDGTSTYSHDPAGGLIGVHTGTIGVLAWTDQHSDVVGDFTASATTLAGSRTYGPLGTVVASNNLAGNLGYQSGFTDSTTGQVNMAARWYNPATGQFNNRDSASNNPTPNSAAANQYAYANDNPLTTTDPTGHRATEQDNSGKIYFVSAATQGKTDVAWGAKGTHDRGLKYQKPTRDNWQLHRPAYTVTADDAGGYTSKYCGSNADCRKEHHQELQDVNSQIQKQIEADLARCGPRGENERCYDAVGQRIANGGYWAEVDGNYETVVDGVLISVSPDRQVVSNPGYDPCSANLINKAACFIGGAWNKATNAIAQFFEHSGGNPYDVLSGMLHAIADGVKNAYLNSASPWDTELNLMNLVVPVKDLVSNIEGSFKAAHQGDYYGAGGYAAAAFGDAIVVAAAAAALAIPGLGELAGAVDLGLEAAADAALEAGADVSAEAGADVAAGVSADGVADAVGPADLAGGADGSTGPDLASGCLANSFDAQTPVLMSDGDSKPISQVKLGDKVLATDPQSNRTTTRVVTELHLNQDRDLADVTVHNPDAPSETIHTTQHHVFWNDTQHAWTPASALRPGDRLRTTYGHQTTVISVHAYTGSQPMYNLTIATDHTYYVIAGSTPVLVHNEGGNPVPPFVDGQDFEWTLPTPKGNVGMLAETTIDGTNVTLSDVAVYGDNPELTRGSLGARTMLSALRGTIAPAAADQGFTSLTIKGIRATGPVGHRPDFKIDLTKYGTGGSC